MLKHSYLHQCKVELDYCIVSEFLMHRSEILKKKKK